MNEEVIVKPVVEPVVAPVVETVEQVVETPKTKNELTRELSKDLGIDLFNVEGIKKFREYQESQKTATDKLTEQLAQFEVEKNTWLTKQTEYESKLKASELGIPQDKLEDALKLAGGKVENLASVLEKYPTFKTSKGIKIGRQETNTFQAPNGNTEAEQYMAQNPRIYKK